MKYYIKMYVLQTALVSGHLPCLLMRLRHWSESCCQGIRSCTHFWDLKIWVFNSKEVFEEGPVQVYETWIKRWGGLSAAQNDCMF